MTAPLDAGAITIRLAQLRATAPLDECWTCECLQGYLAQLQMDGSDDGAAQIAPLRVHRTEIHSCLGCDPCPPGDIHATYLRPGAAPIILF